MTQQPYAQPVQQYPPAPQYPQAPQQVPPQQYAQPVYPQAPQPYAQPVYQQPYAQPQPPAQQPAAGSLDAFYAQPSGGSGPAISWSANGMQKPLGTTYAGIVARDVTHADIQQDSDPKTGQLKTFKDGRAKFFMKVPLKVAPSPEFPEGEATWYVRGQSRDELVRAMTEAGINDPNAAPKAGDAVSITLIERRPPRNGQGMPANVVQVRYQPAGGTGAPSPAPVPQQAPPVQYEQPQAPPEWAQPMQQPAQVPQAQPVQQPVQQQAPAQPVDVPAPTPPSDLSPDQQALLAKLTGGGQ